MTALSFTEAAFASASPADRAFFLQHCMGPSESVPFNLVHNAFEHHARATPHATAVEHTSENESITYADLDRRANRLAHRLRGHGIGPNQRVCILARRSIVNVIAIIAVLKAGGQYVPLDGDTITDVNLDYVLSDSATPLVLCMEEYLHRVSAAPALVLEATINADERCGADCSKPTELATTADGCYVIYTSGTTGKPKGVDVKHSGVVNFILTSPGTDGMGPGVRVSQLLNIAFDFAAWEMLGSLSNGCTVCLRGNSSAQWRSVLKTVDIVMATPSMLSRHHPADYPTIKHVKVAGEQCPQELADLWSRYASFHNGSGPTEVSMGNTLDRFVYGRRISIGRPIPNTTVYILDDDLQPVPVGETGVMWCGGVGLSRGYLNRPDKTAERFRPDPFLANGRMMFDTGDLGRFRPDGSLDHLGRLDDLVKVNGFRVELDGVSAAMNSCPGVESAVALMVGKEMWGFVTPETAQQEVVRDHTAALYPYYAVPTKYLSLSTFPLTRNGKVDKTVLRSMAERTEVTPLTIPRNIPTVPSTPPLDISSSASSSPTLSSALMTPNIDDVSIDLGRGSKRQSYDVKASPDQSGFDAPDSSTLRGLYPNDVNIVLS